MNVLLFGATGMVGQGVLRECLLDPGVEGVLAIGRSATGQSHPKLRELAVPDLSHLATYDGELAGFDACFFCLGVSAAGMSEAAYTRVTYDLTLAVATALAQLEPRMVFVYVSGRSTDSSERGRVMWARVKGRTENALLRLPFRAAYMFRPGAIRPLHGIRSRTRLYRVAYAILAPIYPIAQALAPDLVTTTEQVGRAMLAVVRTTPSTRLLESADIRRIGRDGR